MPKRSLLFSTKARLRDKKIDYYGTSHTGRRYESIIYHIIITDISAGMRVNGQNGRYDNNTLIPAIHLAVMRVGWCEGSRIEKCQIPQLSYIMRGTTVYLIT